MSFSLRSTAPAALALAAVVVVSGTTGAVAGGMITGKNIKDNTVTTDDVKDLSVLASDTSRQFDKYMRRVGGYRAIHRTATVDGGTQGFLTAACPGETTLLGSQGFWRDSTAAAGVEVLPEDGYTTAVRTFAPNLGTEPDVLHLIAFCGRTSPS